MFNKQRRSRLVQVNAHALEQYRARGGRGNLQKVVEGRLRSQLKRGVTTTGDLLVEVPVPRLKALCTPEVLRGLVMYHGTETGLEDSMRGWVTRIERTRNSSTTQENKA